MSLKNEINRFYGQQVVLPKGVCGKTQKQAQNAFK
jgi:hypothetical protein